MHSIRTKVTLLNVIAVAVAMTVTTVISAVTIANFGHESSEKLLKLSCETGRDNLDDYFISVKDSVQKVQEYVQGDLSAVAADADADTFASHIARVNHYFSEAAIYTQGVLTYYYRINPDISDKYKDTAKSEEAKGFYYEKSGDKDNYSAFPVTDLHPLDDGSKRPGTEWYFDYVPEANPNRESKWLPPYTTNGLNEYVISRNAPIYKNDTFYGVVGIEIGYETLGNQVKNLKIHETGFAYIIDEKTATLIYHPDVDLIGTLPEDRPAIPENLKTALKSGQNHLEYKYEGDGKNKHAYWLPLENGMCIVVAVPLSEVNSTWQQLVIQIVLIGLGIIALFTVITILYTRHFTKPLRELTEVAEEINEGHYNAKLDYNRDDEIGILTNTVNKLVDHLGGYIQDLNSLAYADALTSVRNKSAFDLHIAQIQESIDKKEDIRFAIGIFDCDDLKDINDSFGHDKGDVYLKNSCHLICRVFNKSPVFRIGGDEFAVILQGEDYQNKEKLRKYFIEKSAEISAFAKEPWEQIRVAVGIAEFNSDIDKDIGEVIRRADHLMYENKHTRKKSK